jgi:hypothetical protein
MFRRTAGDITLNANAAWADLPTIGTTWDITLAAQVGDVIEAGLSGVIDSAVTISYFDVVTIVAGVATNSFGSGTTPANANKGVMGWYCATTVLNNLTGSVLYTLASGDLSAGLVTVRLRSQNSNATTRNLHGTVDFPLAFWAKNLGPMDPN